MHEQGRVNVVRIESEEEQAWEAVALKDAYIQAPEGDNPYIPPPPGLPLRTIRSCYPESETEDSEADQVMHPPGLTTGLTE